MRHGKKADMHAAAYELCKLGTMSSGGTTNYQAWSVKSCAVVIGDDGRVGEEIGGVE